MRYYRYRNQNKTEKSANRKHYQSLTADEKRTVCLEAFWRKTGVCVFFTAWSALSISSFWLIKEIPSPSTVGLTILYVVGVVLLGLITLILSALVATVLATPFFKKADKYNLPLMKKEILSKACDHLRKYYELKVPYLVTKCYEADDERFNGHDVCLFVVKDELRMTVDLYRGFLHGDRDLGCYAFSKEEITLSYMQKGSLTAIEIKTDTASFLLGKRAKSFITRYFLTPQDPTPPQI